MTDAKQNTERGAQARLNAAAVFSRLGPLIGLLFVWLLFAILSPSTFLTWENHRLMLLLTAVVGTAAIGATLIIISGGIDLSVGSMIALGTMVVALVLNLSGSPTLAALGGIGAGLLVGMAIGAIVIGHVGRVAAVVLGAMTILWTWNALPALLAIGAGCGALAVVLLVNELLIKRIPIAPFIVTLGMWGALRGAAKGLGDNQPVYTAQNWLYNLMRTAPGSDASASRLEWLADQWSALGDGFGPFVPWSVWILFALALGASFMLRYTRFGRHIFAIGSNEQTARLAGVHVERTKLLIYIVGIGCAGLAALLQFSYLNMGDPTTAEGYELKVIAAVVIGGASLSGGEGSIRGTIVGALIMTVVDNGCTKLGLDNWVQEIVTGAIIVMAVALDRLRHRPNG